MLISFEQEAKLKSGVKDSRPDHFCRLPCSCSNWQKDENRIIYFPSLKQPARGSESRNFFHFAIRGESKSKKCTVSVNPTFRGWRSNFVDVSKHMLWFLEELWVTQKTWSQFWRSGGGGVRVWSKRRIEAYSTCKKKFNEDTNTK